MLLHKTLLACFGVIVFCHSAFAERCENSVASLLSFEGSVSVRWGESEGWQKAEVGDGFCYGDTLQVTHLRAVISLENDTLVKLNQGSTIKFLPPDESFWVELVEGAARFISRTPKKFKVKAPYLNAAVEGTEFVVEHTEERGIVTVFDGRVIAFNDAGETALNALEQSESFKGQAPTPALRIQLAGLATWTHYVPPVYVPENASTPAAKLFERGHLRKSFEQASQEGEADLAAVLAQFYGQEPVYEQNQPQLNEDTLNRIEIFKLLEEGDVLRARASNDQWLQQTNSVNALVVSSHVLQAEKQLQNAFSAMKQASRMSNSIWVKLRTAELAIMLGRSRHALSYLNLQSAEGTALAYGATLKALVNIQKNNYSEAAKLLEQAIAADSNYPTAHMLLGMVKIRQGDLARGRGLLEQAAMLDPNNSLLRSYLGQSYAEEGRWDESVDELEIAARLDSKDPTPWYFLAFGSLDRSEYLSAKRQFEKSIELNNSRAIYRSNELVESDVSARLTQLGMLYRKLGLTESSKRISTEMLQKDRLDYFGHLLQVGASANEDGQASATATSRLLATINQPIGATYLPIDLMGKPLNIQSSATPINTGLHEYSNLFRSKDISGNVSLMRSGRGGDVNDLSAQIISGQVAIDVARYTYETDGYRENNDASYEVTSSMLHWQPIDQLSLQYEIGEIEGEFGDLYSVSTLVDEGSDYDQRSKTIKDIQRLSAVYEPSDAHSVLLNVLKHRQDFNFSDFYQFEYEGDIFEYEFSAESKSQVDQVDINYHYIPASSFSISLGYSDGELSSVGNESFFGVVTDVEDQTFRESIYVDVSKKIKDKALLLVGVSYEDTKRTVGGESNGRRWEGYDEALPQVGFNWKFSKGLDLRAAYSEFILLNPDKFVSLNESSFVGIQSVLGFQEGSWARMEGVGADWQFTDGLLFRLNAVNYDIESPILLSNEQTYSFVDFALDKELRAAFIEYQPMERLAISLKVESSLTENNGAAIYENSLPQELREEGYQFDFGYYPKPNAELSVKYIYLRQTLDYTLIDQIFNLKQSPDLLSVSAALYFLEKRGRVSVNVENLLDENYLKLGDETFGLNQTFPDHALKKTAFIGVSLSF